jgi:hypothetical protein
MKEMLSFGLIVTLLCASAACAQEGPKQAFDATYIARGPGGSATTIHMISDGKGHLRNETTTNGTKMVSITDFPNHCVYTVLDAQKVVMKMPMRSSGQADIHDNESARKANATPLGSKIIAGHPCHGWAARTEAGTNNLWIGDDIDHMVRSESKFKTGQTATMELKSWDKSTPSPSLFQAPAGYKVTQMPGS